MRSCVLLTVQARRAHGLRGPARRDDTLAGRTLLAAFSVGGEVARQAFLLLVCGPRLPIITRRRQRVGHELEARPSGDRQDALGSVGLVAKTFENSLSNSVFLTRLSAAERHAKKCCGRFFGAEDKEYMPLCIIRHN